MKPDFRAIIACGRNFDDYELLKTKCDYFLSQKLLTHNVIIISGMANGADSLGCKYALEKGLKVEEYPANWTLYGRSAGPIRNKQMAQISDALIAFWDGINCGTKSMIDFAKELDLKVAVVYY